MPFAGMQGPASARWLDAGANAVVEHEVQVRPAIAVLPATPIPPLFADVLCRVHLWTVVEQRILIAATQGGGPVELQVQDKGRSRLFADHLKRVGSRGVLLDPVREPSGRKWGHLPSRAEVDGRCGR